MKEKNKKRLALVLSPVVICLSPMLIAGGLIGLTFWLAYDLIISIMGVKK